MAMTSQDLKYPIDHLERCGLCLKKFREPRLLPCFDSFCKECLSVYIDAKGNGKTFSCPLCSESRPSGSVILARWWCLVDFIFRWFLLHRWHIFCVHSTQRLMAGSVVSHMSQSGLWKTAETAFVAATWM
jgi:hypothetical protein